MSEPTPLTIADVISIDLHVLDRKTAYERIKAAERTEQAISRSKISEEERSAKAAEIRG